MTVNIVFSDTSGGNAMAETQDSGTVTPGADSDEQDLFIRHDAVSAAITNCAWYITRCVSTGYLGSDADSDITEILGWGDSGDGFQINQVAPPSWTEGSPFGSGDWDIFKNGHGDIDNQIPLDEDSIILGTPAGDGVIPVGGEAHVQVKWAIPSDVALGSGYRGLSLVFAYSATS